MLRPTQLPTTAHARLALAALLLAAMVGCSRDQPPTPEQVRCEPLARPAPATPRNVVFVLADTTRRDHVGIYGGTAKTPRFDAFARDALLFTAAETQAPWTKPAIATLFTGLPPSAHGVVSHPGLGKDLQPVHSDVLGSSFHTLAEALAASGFQTAAFVSNPWVQRRLRFDQGFETWDESMADNATPGQVVTAAGLRWLREREGDPRPFFLYLHYMDAHTPYHEVPAAALAERREAIAADARPLTELARKAILGAARDEENKPLADRGIPPSIALLELVYDIGVENFDRALGQLLDALAQRADWDETAVVVTSDHGEALYERGYGAHGYGLHGDEIAIPLAAWLPGVETRGAISCPVGLIDLRRTLCDYLGVDCPGGDRGTSLFSDAVTDPTRLVMSEAVLYRPRNRAVRDARYKLLFEPDGRVAVASPSRVVRFYDLEADPGETTDLAAGGVPDGLHESFRRLRAAAEASAAAPRAEAGTAELDEATQRRLEDLGYLEPAD